MRRRSTSRTAATSMYLFCSNFATPRDRSRLRSPSPQPIVGFPEAATQHPQDRLGHAFGPARGTSDAGGHGGDGQGRSSAPNTSLSARASIRASAQTSSRASSAC